MLIVIVAACILAAVPMVGGRYSDLAALRVRGVWLVFLALGVQILIISVLDIRSETVSQALHISTYLMLGVCLVANRSIRHLWVVTAGWCCNFVVIVANGGVMPTSAAAARAIGRTSTEGFENSAPADGARLAFLGDIFPTPRNMPLANVVSIGDLLLLTGFAAVLFAASRTPQTVSPIRTVDHVAHDT